MALRIISSYFSLNVSKTLFNKVLGDQLVPPITQIQTRGKQNTFKRRKTHPFIWLPKRRNKDIYKEQLTGENVDFLAEVQKDVYLQSGESPFQQLPATEEEDGSVENMENMGLNIKLPAKGEWKEGSVRCGAIGRKIGIYPMWTKDAVRVQTTLVQIEDCHVIKYHPPEHLLNMKKTMALGRMLKNLDNNCGCLIVGHETMDPSLLSNEYLGLFNESGVAPKRTLRRFIITPNATLTPGTPIFANHFAVGDFLDVSGKTTDHGFQGVMQRHMFKGGPAGHGATKFHRKGGTIGCGKLHGIWGGKKMPGHMGSEYRTFRGVEILRINTEYNVLYLRGGSIPGQVGDLLTIKDCGFQKHRFTEEHQPPCFPTYYEDKNQAPPVEIWHKSFHNFSDPSITFEDKVIVEQAINRRKNKKNK